MSQLTTITIKLRVGAAQSKFPLHQTNPHLLNFNFNFDKTMLDPGSKKHLPTTYNSYRSSREFGAERKLISDDDTGISSPPLWGTVSPARSPDQNHYRSLSPSSRAQAIARGQKELMEMVSKMPEGCYELSLRDIVEHTGATADPAKEDESFADESLTDETISIIKNQSQRERKKKQVVQQMSRSGSMDHNHNGGFLLNILFPVSFGSTKGKKKTTKTKVNDVSSNSNSGSGRVSPRPLLVDGSVKIGENEWWKKNRFVEAEESESGGLSSNSGSSKSTGSSASTNSSTTRNTSANGRHGEGGCWGFIFRKKGKKKAKEKGG